MLKRELTCSVCGKKIEDGEEIYAKMTAPKHKVMVEIKAYLQKNSEIICHDCYKKMEVR